MITITGDKEIDAIFKELPRSVSHRVMGNINAAAAKIVVDEEQRIVPIGETGRLYYSIGAYRLSQSVTEDSVVRVGPRRRSPYRGFHGHLVEFGTGPRRTRAGANRGVMTKKPFAKPAFERTKGRVEQFYISDTRKIVLRTMRRYAK
jgi:hypothetical protein